MASKMELVNTVAERTRLAKSDVTRVLDEAFAEIRRTVDGGETVTLRGFGTFRISERAARKGRNPRNRGGDRHRGQPHLGLQGEQIAIARLGDVTHRGAGDEANTHYMSCLISPAPGRR